MGKISYNEGGGGRQHRDSDRRRDRDYQSGRFGKRNERHGDSRGRSNVINNNRDRDSQDLRSRIGKKSSVENTDRQEKKRNKPVKVTPVKLNHIEEEEKKEEDLELRQMKKRKLNPNAFAFSSIVRKHASENTKVKNPSTKSKGAKAFDDDPDVKIMDSDVKDQGKKFSRTVKSKDGAIQIANDKFTNVEKKPPAGRTIKFRADSPVRKTPERTKSISPLSEQSSISSDSRGKSHYKKRKGKKSKRKRKGRNRKVKKESNSLEDLLNKCLGGKGLSSEQIETIKSDPTLTKEELQELSASGLFETKEEKKGKKRRSSSEESSSESDSDSSSSSDSGSRKKKKGKKRKPSPVKSSSESESGSDSSSSSDSDDEKLDDTSSIQSCEPDTMEDIKRVDSSRKSKGDELSIDEELALNSARLKALQTTKSIDEELALNSARLKALQTTKSMDEGDFAEEHEFYVNSKETTVKNHQSRDTLPPHEKGGSRSVSVKDKKGSGDSSLNDEEVRKQKLLNRSRQKSKSTTDIKSRLGFKIGTDSLNNASDRLSQDLRGEKRSSPSDHISDRSKRRRSDHVSSRERTSDIKRESSNRRTRSPYDRRTRSPYERRTRSPPDRWPRSPHGRRTRSPYDQRSRSHRDDSFDRRERSPVRYQRSRSRDDKRSLLSLSKTTSGKYTFTLSN